MIDINKNILTKESKMSDAIRILQESNYKLVLIMDNKKLVGTITDGDIRRGLLNNLNLDNKCHEIMNKNPTIAHKKMLVGEAINIMNDKKITSLFICEDKKPIGIVHIHDLLRLTS